MFNIKFTLFHFLTGTLKILVNMTHKRLISGIHVNNISEKSFLMDTSACFLMNNDSHVMSA
jgi:hypothetical protein